MKSKYEISPSGILSYPVPPETETYVPVSNKSLLTLIIKHAKSHDLKLAFQRYRSSKNGIFSGTLGLSSPKDRDFSFMISFVNSYNKQRKLIVAAGASVLICENGCVFGDVTMLRKHTGAVREEVEKLIETAFEKRMKVLDEVVEFRDKCIDYSLSERKVGHLIGEMLYEKELLSLNEVSAVIGEIKNSTHFAMENNKTNLWSLYNNITEVLKNSHPTLSITKDSKIAAFFKENILGEHVEKPFSFQITGQEGETEESAIECLS